MLWKHLAAAGLAATAAQASLVVPDISLGDFIKAIPVAVKADSPVQKQTIRLDCPGCPVHLRNREGRWNTKTDLENHLELDFTIDTATGVDRLLVNDFELYPESAPWYSSLSAPQVVDFTQAITKHPHKAHPLLRPLGYSLSIRPVVQEEEADGEKLDLIEIDLQVIEVGNSFVQGIPNVNVKLLRTASGKLMIAAADKTPSTTASAETPGGDDVECETTYCRWRAAVIKSLKSMKHNCPGAGRASSHGDHPSGHGHKHMSGQYRKHHTWGRLVKNVAWSIFLPVIIGLVAGIGVSM